VSQRCGEDRGVERDGVDMYGEDMYGEDGWRCMLRSGMVKGKFGGSGLLFREVFAYFGNVIDQYVIMEIGNMTEKEKMLSGMEYSAVDAQLLEELNAVKEIIHEYNQLAPSQTDRRLRVLKGLLGNVADDEIIINQPFYCDYGKQISVGRRFFANFHLTILDEARVTIGDDCFIGPNVSIYTACHSTDPVERNSRREWAEPVTIGDNVWIGGSVTILPGVTIGNNVTIGAGSVVTKDIPDNVVAVGNPCRVVKKCGALNAVRSV
jgi:maltose O-acetyltransferase